MTPANRARMREVIGRAVRTGSVPGRRRTARHGHDRRPGPGHRRAAGTNDAGVDTLPTRGASRARRPTGAARPPGLPRRERFQAALEALAGVVARGASTDEAARRIVAGHRRRAWARRADPRLEPTSAMAACRA